ncbi:bloom syndrome protein [Fusarium austroafricanum]|uniref:Bloom syndrome protein n=1 Tax=Fusarium austroafricanum TaxID=2364996 RepID=A0A8H4K2P0_9HYPO|nr:bloom syndrome protein [Fusarium austroafricanum]
MRPSNLPQNVSYYIIFLAITAKQHGYTASLAAPPTAGAAAKKSAAPLSGRLKGKARKEAKQQQKQHVTPSGIDARDAPDPPPKPKYVLAIRDFVPLAEFISRKLTATTPMEANNGAGVPLFFSTALERAICVRKMFSMHLSETNKHLSSQANTAHAYFVSVLEKVRYILFKVEGGSGVPFNMASKKGATNANRNNSVVEAKIRDFSLFQMLQVYEPTEDFLNSPDVVLPAPSSPIDLEYTVENDESETECIFAFTALLKDLIKLRKEVSNLWNEYHSGKIDLAAAAVGANLAIELARSIEEEMALLLKKHGGALALLPKYFGAKEQFSDDMNFACYDIGATFLYNAASLLETIRTAAPHNARHMPCYTGKFGWYDAQRAHLETTDNRQRWAQDKAALLEVIPNITLLFELEGIPVLDEFACGVKYMFETQEVPAWLCFAVQNYLDTLRFFGPNITKVLAEFHRFNEITADLLDLVNLADYPQNDAKKDLEDMRKMVTVKINGVDIFTASRMALNRTSRNESANRSSSFLLHNPLFCGLWIHYARVLLHQIGVKYAAKPGAVLHAVQLYTAVRQQQQQQQQEHLVPVPEWPDLDRLVAMQGLQAFFVGTGPPASLQAYFKNYCMSRGVSPANCLAAANRRKGKQGKVLLQRSRAGIRELKFGAPVSLCCAARMEKRAIAEPTRRAWNAEVMQQILETSGWFKMQQEGQAKEDGAAETEFQAGAAADRKIKAKAKAAPAHPTLTAPQLVHCVAHAIQTEMPDLVFDYFAMHKMARGLLEKVRAQADDIGLPLMLYTTTDVADIAGLVFAVAAKEMASRSGQSQGVLGKVAMVIREYVIAELDVDKCPT